MERRYRQKSSDGGRPSGRRRPDPPSVADADEITDEDEGSLKKIEEEIDAEAATGFNVT